MIEMEFIKESNITSFIYCIFCGMDMYGTSRTIYQNECGENSYPMMLMRTKNVQNGNIKKIGKRILVSCACKKIKGKNGEGKVFGLHVHRKKRVFHTFFLGGCCYYC